MADATKISEILIHVGSTTEKVTVEELYRFAVESGLAGVVHRCSIVFLTDLYAHERFAKLEVCSVVDEINALETDESSSRTKPAEKFRHVPLKGLLHKHYFSTRFIATNLLNINSEARFERVFKEVLAKHPPGTDDAALEAELARRVTIEALEERELAGKLTGEWIVFTKHAGSNYYLCLASHHDEDTKVFGKIRTGCLPQFPFLTIPPRIESGAAT